MLRMLKKYETSLAEVTYMLECGWEVVESDEWGYWLTKEIQRCKRKIVLILGRYLLQLKME